jgi:hypothetical protein
VLVPVGRGIYARATVVAQMASDPVGEHALRLASVLAATKPGDAGSHHSAAVIHGPDLLGPTRPDVAVTRPPGGSQKGRPGVHLHISGLPLEHVVERGGIRLTSVARTVVDLARTSSFRSGVVVADSALRSNQTSKAELQSVITDCARWPGLSRAKLVVEFADGRSESVLESISRVAFRDQGLPAPELQVWVGADDEGVIGRADSCGGDITRSVRPTGRSSTRTRRGRFRSCDAMRTCARRASRWCISRGMRSSVLPAG